MFPAFILTLTAQVPAICRIEANELFCNTGYSLYIEGSDGTKRLVETSGPNIRTLAPLPEGEHYLVEASDA